MTATRSPPGPEMREGNYTGWWVSVVIIALVLAIGGGLWFAHHPI